MRLLFKSVSGHTFGGLNRHSVFGYTRSRPVRDNLGSLVVQIKDFSRIAAQLRTYAWSEGDFLAGRLWHFSWISAFQDV